MVQQASRWGYQTAGVGWGYNPCKPNGKPPAAGRLPLRRGTGWFGCSTAHFLHQPPGLHSRGVLLTRARCVVRHIVRHRAETHQALQARGLCGGQSMG